MLVIVGPSASGKSEIVKKLNELFKMEKFVTCTTREMRVVEIQDIDYHFMTKEEFENHIKNNDFIEYVTYNSNYYGTLKSEVNPNKAVILEPNGFKNFKNNNVKIYSCYLDVNENVRYSRMINRGDGIDNANKRLKADRLVFNKSLANIVNFTLDTTDLSADESAKIIYEKYRKEFM